MTGPNSTILSRIWWHSCECISYLNHAETDKTIHSAKTALKLAEESAVRVMDTLIHFHAAMANLTTGCIDAGRECLKTLETLAVSGQLMNEVCHHQIAGILAWHEGDLARSESLLSRTVELMEWFAPHPKRPQMGHDVSIRETSKQKRGKP